MFGRPKKIFVARPFGKWRLAWSYGYLVQPMNATVHMVTRSGMLLFDRGYFYVYYFQIFRFWLGGTALQTPRILAGGAKPPQTCNGKHIQFISIECNLMLRVISEASVMTCSSHDSRDMSSIRLIFKGSPIPYSQTFI